MSAPNTPPRERVHELKCWAPFYGAVQNGTKTFDLRPNDRDFRVGDTLLLREWLGTCYSGRTCSRTVTYLVWDMPAFGLMEGYCIMGITPTTDDAIQGVVSKELLAARAVVSVGRQGEAGDLTAPPDSAKVRGVEAELELEVAAPPEGSAV